MHEDIEPLVVVHSVRTWLSTTETWLYNQIRLLPARIESHVVCDRVQNLDVFPFTRLHSVESLPPFRRRFETLVRRVGVRDYPGILVPVARETAARVLHSHYGHVGWKDRGAARAARLAHVVTFYGADVSQWPRRDPRWRSRYRSMLREIDLVLCEGPHMRETVLALGCPPERATVHHLGVDLARIAYEPRSWSAGQPLRVLLAGTFREKKGLPYAIQALGRLHASRRPLSLEVTVIGDATGKPGDDEEKRRILAAIRESGLGDSMRLLGFQPYSVLLEEAGKHHVFLSPSVSAADGDTEGGAPLTIIELAASGMPVVSSLHCDIPNVLEDGVSGLLAPERDVDGLASRLEWLVDHPERWRHLTDSARARIDAEFDGSIQGARLAAIYERVAATKR